VETEKDLRGGIARRVRLRCEALLSFGSFQRAWMFRILKNIVTSHDSRQNFLKFSSAIFRSVSQVPWRGTLEWNK